MTDLGDRPVPPPLGRLERVPLREVWASEAADFTPWLARPENLALLGEALHLDLAAEGREQAVGPFRADLLCKDAATDAWVLIENQLERTDHSHLGQLLTYAAGLDAVSVVWVAERFTDEHRAALDWLNRVTAEHVNFFGLEVEVWRIGDSPPAPRFNVASQPNGWARSVAAVARRAADGEPSERGQAYREFWQGLADQVRDARSVLRHESPQPRNYFQFATGRTEFKLLATFDRGGELWASLVCFGPDLWPVLLAVRADAEAAFGGCLDWDFKPGRKQNYVNAVVPGGDLSDRGSWPDQIAALRTTLERLHAAFVPWLKGLRPAAGEATPGASASDGT